MSYDTLGNSYCPFREEYDDALIAAIREYTHYKTSDGLAPIVGGPDVEEINSSAQGNFTLPKPTQENFPVNDFTVITYVYLRRWLQANGKEAVAALAEDCIQYTDIGPPPSRTKWTRAILCSVETEKGCSDVLLSLTGGGTTEGTMRWQAIRRQLQASPSSTVLVLHDNLFYPVLKHVVRGIITTYLTPFLQSNYYKAMIILITRFMSLQGVRLSINDFLGQGEFSIRERLEQLSRQEVQISDYQKLGVIGSGSYGSVHVWRHKATKTLYSVKVCSKDVLKAKSSVHTVIRELACSLAVDSPWVERYEWVTIDKEHIYLAQRFVEKGDLERFLLATPSRRFDESVAKFYVAQIILALRRLHSCGVLHRDLKASNILVDSQGFVTLTDYGLSVFLHRCSKLAPDYARVCKGEQPESSDVCCLGCLQVSKLKTLQSTTESIEKTGVSPATAGRTAADTVRETAVAQAYAELTAREKAAAAGSSGHAMATVGTNAEGTESGAGASQYSTTTNGGMDMYNNPTGTRYTSYMEGAASMPVASVPVPPSGMTTSSSTNNNNNNAMSPARTKGSLFRGLLGARSGNTPNHHHQATSTSSVQDPSGVSAPGTSVPGSASTYSTASNPTAYPYMASSHTRDGLAHTESHPVPSTDTLCGCVSGSVLALNNGTPVTRMCSLCHVSGPLLAQHRERYYNRLLLQGFCNPTVLVVSDCLCHSARQDDGLAWYRGRAGTAAYWCPQMISRGPDGERLPYGVEADWWSLGALTYALMTGRSPFASGMGTAHDNALTLEGRISWPKGIFSAEAKDFISLLCMLDNKKRLGGGPVGWKDVQSHPFFRGIDWGLLEARVLPAPLIPPYKIATDWTRVPEKIEGQYTRGAIADEAALEMERTRNQVAKVTRSGEDEAIFRACCFTSPDYITRMLLKTATWPSDNLSSYTNPSPTPAWN